MSFLPQMEPWLDDRERQAVDDYMREGGWLTEFKRTEAFEKAIASYTGAKHCVVVNNGTISLTLAALAVGVKAGDEVLIPNYTMIASPNSVKMFGAVPVFVDVEPSTLCMDVEKARAAITPRTKALMLVTANGRYPKAGISAFEKLCAEEGIILIEDSAQSLGSRYPDGRHMGLAGAVGSFSFSAPKVITTGQGGALVTNDDGVAHRLRRLKDFGRSGGGNDVHDSIGYNFKFTEMQAAIGLVQMEKLETRVQRKKAILNRYRANLKDVKAVSFFHQDLENTTPWFIDTIIAHSRSELIAHLKDRGIGTRVMYPPINKQAAYQVSGEHQVSEMIGRQGLWLPSQSQLTDTQIDRVCEEIAGFFAAGRS